MFVFEDRFCVELTIDQQKFIDTHGVGMNRFRKAHERDMNTLSAMTFGELVTWLVAKTDLLVEHDASHWSA